MPISRDSFEAMQMSLEEKVLRFLKAHPDQAFSVREIMEGIGEVPPEGTETHLALLMALDAMKTLDALVNKGEVLEGKKQRTLYYAIALKR